MAMVLGEDQSRERRSQMEELSVAVHNVRELSGRLSERVERLAQVLTGRAVGAEAEATRELPQRLPGLLGELEQVAEEAHGRLRTTGTVLSHVEKELGLDAIEKELGAAPAPVHDTYARSLRDL